MLKFSSDPGWMMRLIKKISVRTAAAATAIALVFCGCLCESEHSGDSEETAEGSAPVITVQPADVTTRPGENVTWQVVADGDDLGYQWYYKKSDSARWSVWKGHDSAQTSATANSTWGGMRVYCRITDKYGGYAISRAAKISFGQSVTIKAQPGDVTVNLGQTAFFRVEAAGEGLSYQWYFRKAGSDLRTKWKGHNQAETQAQANTSWNHMQVCCLVTDRFGNSAFTRWASVTVINNPTIISQPQGSRLSGKGPIAFSVRGGEDGLIYQWFYIPKGLTWGVKMKDRNDDTLSLNVGQSWDGTQIYCRVKNPGGRMIFSDCVPVNAGERPLVTVQPQSAAARVGEKIRFSVRAEGSGLRYQWQLRLKDFPAWMTLRGYDDPEASVNATFLVSGAQIRCAVTGANGCVTFSEPAGISVSPDLCITSQPEDITVSSGKKAAVKVGADGENVSFQWYMKKQDGVGWIMLKDCTKSTFEGVADSSWHNMRLICRVSDGKGNVLFSRIVKITVNDILTVHTSPADATVQSGDSPSIAVHATGRGLKYQWLRKAYGSDEWVRWDGQTNSAISLPAETSWHKMKVRCDVTDCTGRRLSSDSARIWITDALDILRQPRSVAVGPWKHAEFSVKAQGRGLRYQWYYQKRDMTHWHIWRGHTSASTSAISNPTWDGMRVKCVITDAAGSQIHSRPSRVRITE